jgi:CubicO group peptidase (beta-lactamase class C family)
MKPRRRPRAKYIPELKDLRVLGDARNDTETGLATVPAKRPVTIRHLLTHTSGISYGVFASTDARLKAAYKRAGVVGPRHMTLAELVERLAKVPLAHQPGEVGLVSATSFGRRRVASAAPTALRRDLRCSRQQHVLPCL